MNDDILQFIPQRPPFVLVDALTGADEHTAGTVFTISKEHVLVEDGALSAAGLLENIAQSAAAGTGAAMAAAGLPAPVGFIGAVKNFVVDRTPMVGETIATRVVFGARIGEARIVDGTVSSSGETLARATLTIFLQTATPAS